MALTAKDLEAISALVATTVASALAQATPARKAKSDKPKVSIADMRATDARVCTAHGGTCGKRGDGHFATPNGQAYHEAHGGKF